MKTFDDFKEAAPSAGPPIEPDPKPPKKIKGKKILRTKPISAMDLTSLAMSGESVASNLKFKQHHRRPFVFWLSEVES